MDKQISSKMTARTKAFLDGMIAALDIEIETVRGRKGVTTRKVHSGLLQRETGAGIYLYKFDMDFELPQNMEGRAELQFSDDEEKLQKRHVEIVSCPKDGVIIAAKERLSEVLEIATLTIDSASLLQSLRDNLNGFLGDDTEGNLDLAATVMDRQGCISGEAAPHPYVLAGDPMNPEQQRAVRLSLGSNVLYLWGPPGTGKTSVLARIVEAQWRAGKKVLLVSNTNIAVDNALYSFCRRVKEEEEFDQGAFQRFGPIVLAELDSEFGDCVDQQRILFRLKKPLEEMGKKLGEELRQVEVRSLELAKLKPLVQQTVRQQKSLFACRERIAGFDKRLEEIHQQQTDIQQEISNIDSSFILFRWLQKKRRNILDNYQVGLGKSRQALLQDRDHELATHNQIQQSLKDLENEFVAVTGKDRVAITIEAVRILVDQINSEQQDIRAQLAALKQRWKELESELKRSRKVLATTATRLHLQGLGESEFDTVIIDEASMLIPPLVFLAATRARKTVIVAGDFRQLSPIVRTNNHPQVEKWLSCDVFTKAGIPDALSKNEELPELVSLSEQYRMHEKICSLVAKIAYPDNPLRTPAGIGVTEKVFPLGESPLLYVDTSEFFPTCSTESENNRGSRQNILHALIIHCLIRYLIEQGYMDKISTDSDTLAVITPFNLQVKTLENILVPLVNGNPKEVASTVHRFQGSQKRIVIFDTVDSEPVSLSGFMSSKEMKENGAKLLNVAFSRAVEHLIIIANFDYLRKFCSKDMKLTAALGIFVSEGQKIDTSLFFQPLAKDWSKAFGSETTAHLPIDSLVVDADNFFHPLERDIISAKQTIVIISPFITNRGWHRLFDRLREASSRGVSVHILTKPKSELKDTEVFKALEIPEIEHHQVHKIHQKVVFIDQEITWSGSLNVLSHRDTSEVMMRFMDRNFYTTIWEVVLPNFEVGLYGKMKVGKKNRNRL